MEGNGASLHIFMWDVSAERSDILIGAKYIEYIMYCGDSNFEDIPS